jgi:hypothetical protein
LYSIFTFLFLLELRLRARARLVHTNALVTPLDAREKVTISTIEFVLTGSSDQTDAAALAAATAEALARSATNALNSRQFNSSRPCKGTC